MCAVSTLCTEEKKVLSWIRAEKKADIVNIRCSVPAIQQGNENEEESK
jgi:hypothetical protein